MKSEIIKRIVAVFLALLLCVGISLISFANTATAIQKRVVEVEADTIVTESFLGLGNNLWTGEYTKNYGMNEAYQTVSDKRNNIVKPAYMRMMFLPGWLVFLDETPERQQELWESGIYNWENENVKSFFRKLKMFKESGTLVMINMGGRVHYEMNEWFSLFPKAEQGALPEISMRLPKPLMRFLKELGIMAMITCSILLFITK